MCVCIIGLGAAGLASPLPAHATLSQAARFTAGLSQMNYGTLHAPVTPLFDTMALGQSFVTAQSPYKSMPVAQPMYALDTSVLSHGKASSRQVASSSASTSQNQQKSMFSSSVSHHATTGSFMPSLTSVAIHTTPQLDAANAFRQHSSSMLHSAPANPFAGLPSDIAGSVGRYAAAKSVSPPEPPPAHSGSRPGSQVMPNQGKLLYPQAITSQQIETTRDLILSRSRYAPEPSSPVVARHVTPPTAHAQHFDLELMQKLLMSNQQQLQVSQRHEASVIQSQPSTSSLRSGDTSSRTYTGESSSNATHQIGSYSLSQQVGSQSKSTGPQSTASRPPTCTSRYDDSPHIRQDSPIVRGSGGTLSSSYSGYGISTGNVRYVECGMGAGRTATSMPSLIYSSPNYSSSSSIDNSPGVHGNELHSSPHSQTSYQSGTSLITGPAQVIGRSIQEQPMTNSSQLQSSQNILQQQQQRQQFSFSMAGQVQNDDPSIPTVQAIADSTTKPKKGGGRNGGGRGKGGGGSKGGRVARGGRGGQNLSPGEPAVMSGQQVAFAGEGNPKNHTTRSGVATRTVPMMFENVLQPQIAGQLPEIGDGYAGALVIGTSYGLPCFDQSQLPLQSYDLADAFALYNQSDQYQMCMSPDGTPYRTNRFPMTSTGSESCGVRSSPADCGQDAQVFMTNMFGSAFVNPNDVLPMDSFITASEQSSGGGDSGRGTPCKNTARTPEQKEVPLPPPPPPPVVDEEFGHLTVDPTLTLKQAEAQRLGIAATKANDVPKQTTEKSSAGEVGSTGPSKSGPASSGFLSSFMNFVSGKKPETLSSVWTNPSNAKPLLPKYVPEPTKSMPTKDNVSPVKTMSSDGVSVPSTTTPTATSRASSTQAKSTDNTKPGNGTPIVGGGAQFSDDDSSQTSTSKSITKDVSNTLAMISDDSSGPVIVNPVVKRGRPPTFSQSPVQSKVPKMVLKARSRSRKRKSSDDDDCVDLSTEEDSNGSTPLPRVKVKPPPPPTRQTSARRAKEKIEQKRRDSVKKGKLFIFL